MLDLVGDSEDWFSCIGAQMTPDREVRLPTLLRFFFLSKIHFLPKVPEEWLCDSMREKLFTGTLKHKIRLQKFCIKIKYTTHLSDRYF